MTNKRTCSKTGKGLKQEIYNIGKLHRKLSRSYDRNKKTLKKENGKEYENFCKKIQESNKILDGLIEKLNNLDPKKKPSWYNKIPLFGTTNMGNALKNNNSNTKKKQQKLRNLKRFEQNIKNAKNTKIPKNPKVNKKDKATIKVKTQSI